MYENVYMAVHIWYVRYNYNKFYCKVFIIEYKFNL